MLDLKVRSNIMKKLNQKGFAQYLLKQKSAFVEYNHLHFVRLNTKRLDYDKPNTSSYIRNNL